MYKIALSSKQNFDTYYVISKYNTLEEAQNNFDKDIKDFTTKHRKFWLTECYGYQAIIN